MHKNRFFILTGQRIKLYDYFDVSDYDVIFTADK